jgi:hypothetical protein
MVQPVCVAGMGRSGTSLCAQLLHRCGIALGRDDTFMSPATDNPDGFWEDVRFVALDDAILHAFGGAWDLPPALPPGWEMDPRLDGIGAEAAGLIHDCGGDGPWGWKDPRASLLLPFWRRFVPDLRVVICLRNPLEVADSLHRRSGYSHALGLALWRRYNDALLALPPGRRLVTAYDAYFDDAARELRRVLDFLGVSVSAPIVAAALSAVSGGLRHHRYTAEDLREAGVAPAIIALHAALFAEARGEGIAEAGREAAPIDDHPADPTATMGQGGQVFLLRRQLDELREYTRTLEKALHDREMEAHDRAAYVADLVAQLAAADSEIARGALYARQVEEQLAEEHRMRAEAGTYAREVEAQLAATRSEYEKLATWTKDLRQQIPHGAEQLPIAASEPIIDA